MRLVSLALVALALCASSTLARADTLTFTESAIASGTLGSQTYTNALITLTGVGTSTGSTNNSGAYFQVVPVTLSIAGLGNTSFTDTLQFVSNTNFGTAGVGDVTGPGGAILFTRSSTFTTYDLNTALAPTTGTPADNLGTAFNTAAGKFILTAVGNSTFSASASAATTPEPSSLLLLATGVAGAAGKIRRRLLR